MLTCVPFSHQNWSIEILCYLKLGKLLLSGSLTNPVQFDGQIDTAIKNKQCYSLRGILSTNAKIQNPMVL